MYKPDYALGPISESMSVSILMLLALLDYTYAIICVEVLKPTKTIDAQLKIHIVCYYICVSRLGSGILRCSKKLTIFRVNATSVGIAKQREQFRIVHQIRANELSSALVYRGRQVSELARPGLSRFIP